MNIPELQKDVQQLYQSHKRPVDRYHSPPSIPSVEWSTTFGNLITGIMWNTESMELRAAWSGNIYVGALAVPYIGERAVYAAMHFTPEENPRDDEVAIDYILSLQGKCEAPKGLLPIYSLELDPKDHVNRLERHNGLFLARERFTPNSESGFVPDDRNSLIDTYDLVSHRLLPREF